MKTLWKNEKSREGVLSANFVNWCGGLFPLFTISSPKLARTTDTLVNSLLVLSGTIVRLLVPKTIGVSIKAAITDLWILGRCVHCWKHNHLNPAPKRVIYPDGKPLLLATFDNSLLDGFAAALPAVFFFTSLHWRMLCHIS